MRDVRRLVGPAPVRHGRQVRAVGLGQHAGPAGSARAAACTSAAALKVTMPLKLRIRAQVEARPASSGPPVKQWNTVRSGMPSARSTSNVSAQASRVWMTSGSARSWASWICAANAVRCASRGEWS